MKTSVFNSRPAAALGVLLVAAALTFAAYLIGPGSSDADAGKDATSSSSPPADPSAGSAEAPLPDLDAIPDVVAEVNGEEVTKEDFVPAYEAAFQQAAAQAQMGGPQPDEDALREQVLDQVVDTELLAQEADARGLEVSDEDVDAELADLAKQNGMSADELLKAVEDQGLDEEQARDQVETQVMVERLVADEDGGKGPTEKELRAIYAQAKQQAAGQEGQKIPPFDQVRDQIEEQAKSEQVGKVADALVTKLRKDADITVKL